MSTPTRSPSPSSVDFSMLPGANRRAYDIVVTCQHMNLSCTIRAFKGQAETLIKIGDEKSLQEIPELLRRLRDSKEK